MLAAPLVDVTQPGAVIFGLAGVLLIGLLMVGLFLWSLPHRIRSRLDYRRRTKDKRAEEKRRRQEEQEQLRRELRKSDGIDWRLVWAHAYLAAVFVVLGLVVYVIVAGPPGDSSSDRDRGRVTETEVDQMLRDDPCLRYEVETGLDACRP